MDFIEFICLTALVLFLVAFVVKLGVRSWYSEKRRHLKIMMSGVSGDKEPEWGDKTTQDNQIVWKDTFKEDKEK